MRRNSEGIESLRYALVFCIDIRTPFTSSPPKRIAGTKPRKDFERRNTRFHVAAGKAPCPSGCAYAKWVAALRAHWTELLRFPYVIVLPLYDLPVLPSFAKEVFHEYFVRFVIEDDSKGCSSARIP